MGFLKDGILKAGDAFFGPIPNRMIDSLAHSASVFNKDPTKFRRDDGMVYSSRPDRIRFTRGHERSIITSVYNRIASDVAEVTIEHVMLDEAGRFTNVIDSTLNDCFTLSANRDQTGRAFILDIVMSLFDEGCIAIVPTHTDDSIQHSDYKGIEELRVCKILEWRPRSVKVRVYNEDTGQHVELILEKDHVAIIENPFYAIMNEPNSIFQRLIRKLNLLDAIDEQSGAGKLDLIIQFPNTIRTDAQKERADQRRHDIERQLAGSKYGIAYTDGTERITQLNRSVENNLMSQIEYLTSMLYNQLGLTQAIFDGTADEAAMLNYHNRTVAPILSAIVDEIKRKFLTKAARKHKQSIMFFKDPFKLVPVAQLAELADKFTRNEIMTSNEMRQAVGMPKSNDPGADELRNKNLSEPKTPVANDPRTKEALSAPVG